MLCKGFQFLLYTAGRVFYKEWKAKKVTSCDSCEFFDYDEEYGDYVCGQNLDEDEMESFAQRNVSDCPYYRYYDEYTFVHKQN